MRRTLPALAALTLTACGLALPGVPGSCPAAYPSLSAHPATLVGGQVRAPLAWQKPGDTDPPSQEAALPGASVSLADGAGNALPGVPATAGAAGTYVMQRVPGGYAWQVTATKRQADGSTLTLRTLARSAAAGATSDLNVATTILTLAVLQGRSGLPGAFDTTSFQRAVALVYQHLAGVTQLDPTDAGAMIALFQGWLAGDPELKALYDKLRGDTATAQPGYDDVLAELAALAGQTPPSELPALPSPRVTAATATPAATPDPTATDDAPPDGTPAIPPGTPLPALAGTVSTLAGGVGVTDVDGPRAIARFTNIRGIAVDADSDVYVAEGSTHRIRRISEDGTVTTVTGLGPPGFADGPAASARFSSLAGLCVGPNGSLLVVDEGNQRIRKLDADGTVSTVAGDGTQGHADGRAAAARFHNPSGIAYDAASGSIYVTEEGGQLLRRITRDGQVETLAGQYLQHGFNDGTGELALFWNPGQVALDAAGKAFFVDVVNDVVRRVDPDGAEHGTGTFSGVTPFAGPGIVTPPGGYVEGASDVARYLRPGGLAFDDRGFFVVADTNNHRIRRIAPDGTTTLVAGSGRQGVNDGVADLAEFNLPGAVAIGPGGVVYVVDGNGGNRIREIL